MNKKELQGNLLLLLTALVWGCAFVAQSVSAEKIGPFTFQAVRSLIGGTVLIPVIMAMDKKKKRQGIYQKPSPDQKRTLRFGGIACGFILCVASCLQQAGIAYTTVGKAGFITAMYILIVPLLGLFFHQRVPAKIWGCILIAAAGLYLLCMTKGSLRLSKGDGLMVLCAVVFSVHILAVDHFSPKTDGIKLACLQFFASSAFAAVGMVIWERPSLETVLSAWSTLLYAGALSCGIGYTLQIIGQKNTRPAVASLLMSLESVFAVLAGAVLLREIPTLREGLGCGLMFAAIILAQLPQRKQE